MNMNSKEEKSVIENFTPLCEKEREYDLVCHMEINCHSWFG